MYRLEHWAAPRAKQVGANDRQSMPATGSHRIADVSTTTTEAEMIETIIVYAILLWGCWLAAQSLTLEGDT